MTTTTQIRSWWEPACKANVANLTDAYAALDKVLKKWNYKPRLGVTGAFNCRPITGGTKYSLHAYDPDGFFYFWTNVRVTKALAVDINWDKNPYGTVLVTDMPIGMIEEIEAIRTKNGKKVWRWGGRYSGNKDAMHFEIIVSPTDLATGVKSSVVIPPIDEDEADDMAKQPYILMKKEGDSKVYRVNQIGSPKKDHIPNPAALAWDQFSLKVHGFNDDIAVVPKSSKEFTAWFDGLPSE